MKYRVLLSISVALALLLTAPGFSGATRLDVDRRLQRRSESVLPDGFVPAAVLARRPARYVVTLKAPSVAQRVLGAKAAGGRLSSSAQQSAYDDALGSQSGALQAARRAGGEVVYRYGTLINGFSADLKARAARVLAARSDVASVRPAPLVRPALTSSVPFIGARKVWRGRGFPDQGSAARG